jgi:hypothetical protein
VPCVSTCQRLARGEHLRRAHTRIHDDVYLKACLHCVASPSARAPPQGCASVEGGGPRGARGNDGCHTSRTSAQCAGEKTSSRHHSQPKGAHEHDRVVEHFGDVASLLLLLLQITLCVQASQMRVTHPSSATECAPCSLLSSGMHALCDGVHNLKHTKERCDVPNVHHAAC